MFYFKQRYKIIVKNTGLFGTLFTLATFGKYSTLNVVYSNPHHVRPLLRGIIYKYFY